MDGKSESHPPQAPPRSPPPALVMRIGRYEVVQALGEGGMGRVLLARDTVLDRLVAVKLVRDDLGLLPSLRVELFDRMRHECARRGPRGANATPTS